MKIQISALMDSELDAHEARDALRTLARDADWRRDWHCYHLIGDALRQEPDLMVDVAARVASALAVEPTVLAPVHASRNRGGWQRPLMAIAATAAGVAVVAWVALVPVTDSGHPTTIASAKPPTMAANVAMAANTSPAADDQSAYLQEYLVAHQAYAPSGSLIGGSNHIRTVTASVVTSGERR